MAGLYLAQGTTAATAATDQHAIAEIWNPSSTLTLIIRRIVLVAFAPPGAGAGYLVRRSSAKGTAGSTVTPGAASHLRNPGTAPQSSFTLELAAFTGQPTLVSGDLDGWVFAAVAASGIVMPYPEGIEIGPGTGLCLVNRAAIVFPTSEVTFLVEEA
jgi:hypothetical protein